MKLMILLALAGLFVEAEAKPGSALYDRTMDPHGFTIFMKDGGWCWYQDPRAIVHYEKVIIGSVRGNGNGDALIGVYDLKQHKALGTFTAHPGFDRDDHNSPVFFPRPDGSVLAVYAKHSREKIHYYRISDPQDYTKWGEEMKIDHSHTLPERDKVTYMNLFAMSAEGKLHNFYRGFEFNPSFVTSTDDGLTWGEDTHFIKSEVEGRHRPYARYAGNGRDRICVTFTDGHPRDYGNSIYYAEFRGGAFYSADGTFLQRLESDGPLRPSDAEVVYKGPKSVDRGRDLSAIGSAWTASLELDRNGYPHIGYSVYLSNTDHRYRIASWNGDAWVDREVAFAGKCLYDRESSYTGLISMDPLDPTVVFISTDVDPQTGQDLGGRHEIYRARIRQTDDVNSIQWKPVTTNSPVRNIRPMVLNNGETRVVLWQRGIFNTYRDYDLDTVGILEANN